MFKKILGLTAIVAVLATVSGGISTAQADTSVFHDPNYDFTISYPDSWDAHPSSDPSVQWQVAPPEHAGKAMCNIKAAYDGRLKIYPDRLMSKAVKNQLNDKFWHENIVQYRNIKINRFSPSSGFGEGFATHAQFSYTENDDKKSTHMTAVTLGSIYGDTKYIMTCTAQTDAFSTWAPVFGNIMDTVTLKAKYHPVATGYYRDFLSDKN